MRLVLMESVNHSCPTLSNSRPNSPHSIPVAYMCLAKKILQLLSHLLLLFVWILFNALPWLTIPRSNPPSWYSLPLFYPFGTIFLFCHHRSTTIIFLFWSKTIVFFPLSRVLCRAELKLLDCHNFNMTISVCKYLASGLGIKLSACPTYTRIQDFG